LPIYSAIRVSGTLVETPEAKQPFEVKASSIELEGMSDSEYPIQKKRHTLEYLRTIAHLRPRTNTYSAVFRVRSILAFAIHKFFQERGFVYAHTPIITASDAEGAGEMFRVSTLDMLDPPKTEDGKVDFSKDFFGKETNTLQSAASLKLKCFALCLQKYLHLWTYLPCGKLKYCKTCR